MWFGIVSLASFTKSSLVEFAEELTVSNSLRMTWHDVHMSCSVWPILTASVAFFYLSYLHVLVTSKQLSLFLCMQWLHSGSIKMFHHPTWLILYFFFTSTCQWTVSLSTTAKNGKGWCGDVVGNCTHFRVLNSVFNSRCVLVVTCNYDRLFIPS
jgi:hypothetical protein